MNDTLKAVVVATTALRLLVSRLRDIDPDDFDLTTIAIDNRSELTIQVGSDAEAAPFLAALDDVDWSTDTVTTSGGWYRHHRRAQWAGAPVALTVCYALPATEDTEVGEPRG